MQVGLLVALGGYHLLDGLGACVLNRSMHEGYVVL